MHMNPKTICRAIKKPLNNLTDLLLPLSGGGHSTFAFGAARKAAPPPAPPLRITARGFTNLRGGHDACASAFSKRSERRAGCRRPSDEQSEERCVKPLLAAVAVPVLPPALPRTARPRIARCGLIKHFPPNRSPDGNSLRNLSTR